MKRRAGQLLLQHQLLLGHLEHILHQLVHLKLLPVVSFLAQIDCLHAVLSICARRVEELARGLVGLAFVVDPIRREELADVPVALAASLHVRV